MLHERLGAHYRIQDAPRSGAINGILYALPIATVLWVAIAGVVYLMI